MSGGAAGRIDLGRLERELVSAVEADRKYTRENDAKFRAVNQKVTTYEEFRDIVKASHLTPLDRKDIVGGARKQPWNPAAHSSSTGGGRGGGEEDTQHVCLSSSEQRPPENAQEFTREWRRLKQISAAAQYQFLMRIGGKHLFHIFRVEISMTLLGAILTVLNEGWQDGDSPIIYSILSNLASTSRFSLSVDFLSRQEKQAVTELLAKLSHQGSQSDETAPETNVHKLAKLYSVDLVM